MRRLDISRWSRLNLGLDVRVAVGLLRLLLDLGQAHLQGLLVFVLLVRIVRDREDQEDDADPQAQRPDQAADDRDHLGQRLVAWSAAGRPIRRRRAGWRSRRRRPAPS